MVVDLWLFIPYASLTFLGGFLEALEDKDLDLFIKGYREQIQHR